MELGDNILRTLYRVAPKKVSCCTVSTAYVFSYNSTKHWRIFIIFGRNVTEKASNHMLLYFLPHLINASSLPCETENTEIVNSLLFLSHPVYIERLPTSTFTRVINFKKWSDFLAHLVYITSLHSLHVLLCFLSRHGVILLLFYLRYAMPDVSLFVCLFNCLSASNFT